MWVKNIPILKCGMNFVKWYYEEWENQRWLKFGNHLQVINRAT